VVPVYTVDNSSKYCISDHKLTFVAVAALNIITGMVLRIASGLFINLDESM
jgi:hypothetical protein